MRERLIDDLAIPAHDLRPALAVGLLDRLLDVLDRLVARQHAGDREEAGLHDRVDARTHAGLLGQLRRRRSRRSGACLLDDLLLHFASAARPTPRSAANGAFSRNAAPGAAYSSTSILSTNSNWWQATKLALVTRYAERIGVWLDAQVRNRDRAGLLGVVDEVALGVEIGFLADDLDRVLVGAHRTVRTEAIEDRRRNVGRLGPERRIPRQRRMRHVVDDADREMVLGLVLREVVEDRLHHRRRELLRRQAVAAARRCAVAWRRATRLPPALRPAR